MKKYDVKNSNGFTVFENNHLYECEWFVSENKGMELTIQDNRPEMIKRLNAISKKIAKAIEAVGGVNPSYEKLVDRIMNDPDNVWVDEIDSSDLMNDYVSLQNHVLDGLMATKLPKRKLTN